MKLEDFLLVRGVHFEKHHHRRTNTAKGLAEAEGVSGYEVAKPVIVRSGKNYTMCVLPAPCRVDLKRVNAALGSSDTRLATEKELAGLFPDCELGAEPPFGNMFGMKTIMDPKLKEDDYLLAQSGTHTDSVRMRRQDWERVCRPLVAEIAADD